MSNLWGSLTPCSWVGPHLRHSLSRLQRLPVGKLVNNVGAVRSCVFGWGRVGEARGIDLRLCAYFETLHYVYAHVCDCAHMVYCITGHSIQSSAPLLLHPVRPPLRFSTRLIFAQPFILARSSARQKETSAQWENALIIHDHLTIQDLVCAAYVAFLISARQPHLLMAVSLLLFCVLYLQINTKRLANNNFAMFARSWWITIRDKFRTNVFAFV